MARERRAPADREVVPGDREGAWLVRTGGRDQSMVDLREPVRLAFDYVQRLAAALDAVLDARPPATGTAQVVHVGGAGLTLPRYVAATRPGTRQVVLEPDEELTALVREHLPLPQRSGIRVRPQDGVAGVAALPDGRADCVVVDAYDDGAVPPALLGTAHLHDVRRALAADGCVLLNVADEAPWPTVRAAVAGLRSVFGSVSAGAEPATLRGRRPGNVLLMAGARTPWREVARAATTAASPYTVLDEQATQDRFGGGDALP
ncbi:MAG: spermidine synthase [Nocardioides sp.]|nr:spermidine synthase [Nocardioides sp.]